MKLTREQEWEALYERLLDYLKPFGFNHILEESDYWLLNDDWGDAKQQKLVVFNVFILTPQFVQGIQDILKTFAPAWSVVVALEIDGLPPCGFTIHSARIEYEWDIDELRRLLKRPDFYK